MNKVLSFIIPSYNVEKYLSKALESFLAYEVLDKIEVLIINDGSRDGTEAVAREYVERYPGTYRLINRVNGGHGAAINTGIQEVSGKYLKVIDADDWVVTDNLKLLVEKLEVCEADVFLNPYHTIDMETGEKTNFRIYCQEYDRVYTMTEILEHWKNFDKCFLFHGIGYKSSFYQGTDCQLTEGIFYEDHEYSVIPCSKAKSIMPFDLYLYQYLIGNTEQSVSSANKLKRITHIEKVALRLAEYGKKEVLSEAGREYVRRKTEAVILSYYAVAFIINPNKRQGRSWCRVLNEKLKRADKSYLERLRRKYYMFKLMNYFRITMPLYERMLSSGLYRCIRHNRKEEKS